MINPPAAPCPTAHRGTCPIWRKKSARRQCDNCGNQMDPTELGNPRIFSFDGVRHYFLDLARLADALSAWLDEREVRRLASNVIRTPRTSSRTSVPAP